MAAERHGGSRSYREEEDLVLDTDVSRVTALSSYRQSSGSGRSRPVTAADG